MDEPRPVFLPPVAEPPTRAPTRTPPGARSVTVTGGRDRELPTASYGSRAGALLIDLAVILGIAIVVGVLYELLIGGDADPDTVADLEDILGEPIEGPVAASLLVGGSVAILAAALYPWIAMGITSGQSIGRRAVGIRVVRMDGARVTWGRAFLREGLAKGLLSLFTVPLLVSYLWPLWEKQRRALHDLMVDTRVVVDEPQAAASDEDDVSRRIGLGS